MVTLGGALPTKEQVSEFASDSDLNENQLRLISITAWLLSDPKLRTCWGSSEGQEIATQTKSWLQEDIAELGELVQAQLFITDSERREELCRLALKHLGLLPEGATEEVAQDRLMMVDSVERRRVMKKTEDRVRKAEELRKKMRMEKIQEAARYTRE